MKDNLTNINQAFESFQTGNEREFDLYFHMYYNSICFFAKRYIQDIATAEDIASEAFLQLWKSREKIESETHLRNWLYKTTWHGCLRWKERQSAINNKQKAIARLAEYEEKDCTENIIRAETLRQVKAAISQLPGQCQKVFFKLYIEGKTVAETAKELELTISTIKNQKARGIKMLKVRLTGLALLISWILI